MASKKKKKPVSQEYNTINIDDVQPKDEPQGSALDRL